MAPTPALQPTRTINLSAAAVLVHVAATAFIVLSMVFTPLETVPGTLYSLPQGNMAWFGDST